MRLSLLSAVIALLCPIVSQAQTTAAPTGTRINPYGIVIGPGPGQVAGGDALATEITRALAAETNKAALDSNAKVLASALTGRPQITPLTTSISTTATVVFNAATFVEVSITLQTYGVQVACTGDGTTPVIGTSPTMNTKGEKITWSSDLPPTGAVRCIASQGTAAISTEAT